MKFIQGQNRNQVNLFPVSLDQSIDPDSRQIMLRNNITEVCYNVQTTVDTENNIPIYYKVTNQNGSMAMGNMVQRARSCCIPIPSGTFASPHELTL